MIFSDLHIIHAYIYTNIFIFTYMYTRTYIYVHIYMYILYICKTTDGPLIGYICSKWSIHWLHVFDQDHEMKLRVTLRRQFAGFLLTNVLRTALYNLQLHFILTAGSCQSIRYSFLAYARPWPTPYTNTVALRTLSPPSGRCQEKHETDSPFQPCAGLCHLWAAWLWHVK